MGNRFGEKQREALSRRKVLFDNLPINVRGDGKMRRPGSQNRKKGYSRRATRR